MESLQEEQESALQAAEQERDQAVASAEADRDYAVSQAQAKVAEARSEVEEAQSAAEEAATLQRAAEHSAQQAEALVEEARAETLVAQSATEDARDETRIAQERETAAHNRVEELQRAIAQREALALQVQAGHETTLEELKNSLAHLEAERDQARSIGRDAQTEMEVRQSRSVEEVEVLRAELDRRSAQAVELEQLLHEHGKAKGAFQSEATELRSQLEATQQRVVALSADLEDSRSHLGEVESLAEERGHLVKKKEEEWSSARADYQGLLETTRHALESARHEGERYLAERDSAVQEKGRLQVESPVQAEALQAAQAEVSRLRSEVMALRDASSEHAAARKDLKKELESTRKSVAQKGGVVVWSARRQPPK